MDRRIRLVDLSRGKEAAIMSRKEDRKIKYDMLKKAGVPYRERTRFKDLSMDKVRAICHIYEVKISSLKQAIEKVVNKP